MARPQLRSATGFGWHRVFHPLCGADPVTLARLVARAGPPSLRGSLPLGVAAASSVLRLPFTLGEAAWRALARRAPAAAPFFILGFPRSGTTHLHNLIAASGQFATVPPILAGLPWEARTLAPLMRPFVDPYLPDTRLIDDVRLGPESPTEDEVALANMAGVSYFHAIYFPRRFRRDYVRALTMGGVPLRPLAARRRAVERYISIMAAADRRPLLLKNPAYTAELGWLARAYPEARFVHIHRDPRAVFASNARVLRIALRELALQSPPEEEIEAAILEAYPAVMDRLAASARDLPPDRFTEIGYEALVDDPLGTLGRVWDCLGQPACRESLLGVERYLAALGRYKVQTQAADQAMPAVLDRWKHYLRRSGKG
jgi:omega-hydroxy-beta-dihydromenaquinone-9 sulfotransferase